MDEPDEPVVKIDVRRCDEREYITSDGSGRIYAVHWKGELTSGWFDIGNSRYEIRFSSCLENIMFTFRNLYRKVPEDQVLERVEMSGSISLSEITSGKQWIVPMPMTPDHEMVIGKNIDMGAPAEQAAMVPVGSGSLSTSAKWNGFHEYVMARDQATIDAVNAELEQLHGVVVDAFLEAQLRPPGRWAGYGR